MDPKTYVKGFADYLDLWNEKEVDQDDSGTGDF